MHLHSVFLLACGFFTAWRCKSTFISLLAILPLAGIPFVLRLLGYGVWSQITGRRFVEPLTADAVTIGINAAAILILGWMAYRAAEQTLAPREPIVEPSIPNRISQPLSSSRSPHSVPRIPFRWLFSSLLWQSLRHNRTTLAALAMLMSVGMVSSLFSIQPLSRPSSEPSFLALGALAGLLGVSWLGVVCFTGDGSAARMRFLADRGVSPTLAWLGRHAIGMWMITVLLLLHTAVTYGVLVSGGENRRPLPSTALVALVVFVVYGVSQWTSQLTRLLAVSAVLAPVLALAAAGWLAASAAFYEAPLGLVLVCGVLPYVASWWQMGRFMDQTRGPAVWGVSLLIAGLFIALPMIPLQIELATLPKLSAARRASLQSQADALGQRSVNLRPIVLASFPGEQDEQGPRSQEQAELLFQTRRSLTPNELIRIPPLTPHHIDAATIDGRTLNQILALATYAKLDFEFSGSSPQTTETLGDWFRILTIIAARLRDSDRLRDQDFADQVEIWLNRALQSDAIGTLDQRDFVTRAKRLLADRKGRYEARRRALLSSWSHADTAENRLGGYSLSFAAEARPVFSGGARSRHLIDAVVDAALRMLEAGEAGQSTEPMRRQLHALLVSEKVQFDDGPYSDRIRNYPLSEYQLPARRWYAGWEQAAGDSRK
ncbi:MAG: hypothetical protein ACF788_06220 [Novipirellula sp. JB048]